MPDYSAARRLEFALTLLYGMGLRISEIVAARVADLAWQRFRDEANGAVEVWELSVIGKSGKERTAPVAPAIVAELQSYLASRQAKLICLDEQWTWPSGHLGRRPAGYLWTGWPALARPGCMIRSRHSLRPARRHCKPQIPRAHNGWPKPVRTGCAIPMAPMRWARAWISRSCNETPGTHRWPPRPSIQPAKPGGELPRWPSCGESRRHFRAKLLITRIRMRAGIGCRCASRSRKAAAWRQDAIPV